VSLKIDVTYFINDTELRRLFQGLCREPTAYPKRNRRRKKSPGACP
jgi:hypothetical protein